MALSRGRTQLVALLLLLATASCLVSLGAAQAGRAAAAKAPTVAVTPAAEEPAEPEADTAAAEPAAGSAEWTEGVATWVDPTPVKGAGPKAPAFLPNAGCGLGPVSEALYPGFALAGVNLKGGVFKGAPQRGCGACLEVKCADEASCASAEPIQITIFDDCGNCQATQLNMNARAFEKLAPLDAGTLPIAFRQVPCAPAAGIILHVEEYRASSGGYAKISFKNVAGEGLSAVEAAGPAAAGAKRAPSTWRPLRNTYGAVWEGSNLPAPPLSLRLTNAAGEHVVLEGVLAAAKANADIPTKIQF